MAKQAILMRRLFILLKPLLNQPRTSAMDTLFTRNLSSDSNNPRTVRVDEKRSKPKGKAH